ncbi:MAG: NAD-dependent epimerase/dehydratase family protein [Acidaminococcales bacterium]|jgi:UDP-glucose 4-epimerase|nr:NAD-dependent epimerase/dehydratase family protein [Acidaminococcales bacterium]
MKILITGGAGFIGSHLADLLLKEQVETVVLDNLSTGLAKNVPDGAKFIKMDVRAKGLADVFAEEGFDAVVHLAAQTMVNVSLDDPFFDGENNILGGINLLEACRKKSVKRVVFSSSAAVYGNVKIVPIKEHYDKMPTSFYGLSKLTFERYLELYQKNFSLDYIVLRFANVYGERQGDGGEGGVISIFAKRAAQGAPIDIFGDGGQTRDFVYAGDIAAGIWRALKSDKINTAYNLSNKEETSINQLAGMLGKITGKKIGAKYGPPRAGDIYRSILDNERAVRNLGWKTSVPLEEGLRRTCEYFANKT